jgi:hypothetical protein
MTKLITCLLLMLLSATALFAQKRPGVRPAQTGIKPGYYFTVDMCHACYYPNWTKDLLRPFQAQGMSAITYEGAMMESANERFASVKMFPRRGLWKDLVYVGTFLTEEAALKALDKFPVVLGEVQRKRSKMGGGTDEGWPLAEGEKVRRTKGNDYQYGFYEIKGCKLVG